jgi:putative transposase
VNGRKRHIVVDTMGLLLAVVVHAANIQDRDGANLGLGKLLGQFPRLQLIWADGAYAGALVDWVWSLRSWRKVRLEITKRSDTAKGFEVIPKRWIVERTLGWFNRYRRLSKDDEFLPESSEAVIYVVMIHLMIRRLARLQSY